MIRPSTTGDRLFKSLSSNDLLQQVATTSTTRGESNDNRDVDDGTGMYEITSDGSLQLIGLEDPINETFKSGQLFNELSIDL